MVSLNSNQVEILKLMGGEQGNSSERRWWSAMEVVESLGWGSGAGIGCAMKALYKKGLLKRQPAMTRLGRRKTLYQFSDAGLAVLERNLP